MPLRGLDTISFNIPGAGVHTITTLDDRSSSYHQSRPHRRLYTTRVAPNTNALNAGINAVPQIELSMTSGGDLHIAPGADGTTIRGLVINNRFDEISVVANNVTIAGNFIGTDPSGTVGKHGTIGIVVQSTASNLTVGGPAPADRNLISGHDVLWRATAGSEYHRSSDPGQLHWHRYQRNPDSRYAYLDRSRHSLIWAG